MKPDPGVQVGFNYEYNQIDLPLGSFETNLYRIEGGWDISPWASVTGNIQYDDISDVVGLFGRTRWIIQPGNELYLVYTHNWQNLGPGLFDRDRDLITLSRGGSTKLNYTFRF